MPLGTQEQWPTEADARPSFERFILLFNEQQGSVDDSPRLVSYISQTYFPGLRLAKSTIAAYRDSFKLLEKRLGDHTLTSLRPVNVRDLLQQIVDEAGEHGIAENTIKHAKHFLSGVFTYARNSGHFDGTNPVQGVKLPVGMREPEDTYAYELDEETKMMKAVKSDLMSLMAIATASFTGLSRAELEGLRWEDQRDGCWKVGRDVVEGVVGPPKTKQRRDAVPLIKSLMKVTRLYHESLGSPATGWVFPSENPKKPMWLHNLLERQIKPALDEAGIQWHGWHAFRRGLASNLSEMGVPDDVIQQILRHGDVTTTQRHYRKTRKWRVLEAMHVFEQEVSRKPRGKQNRETIVRPRVLNASKSLNLKRPRSSGG